MAQGGGGAGAGASGQDEEALKLIVCLVILAVVLFALARMQEERANALIGAIAYLHVVPFAEMVRALPALLDLPWIGNWFFLRTAQTHDFLDQGGFAQMNAAERALVLGYSGRAALVIYGPILLWIALRGQDVRPDQRFRNAHTLESMIHLQTEDWVTARVARHVNPSKGKDISARFVAASAAKKIAAAQASAMPGFAVPRKVVTFAPDTWNRALRPEEWLVAKGLVFDAEAFERASAPEAMASDSEFSFRHEWEKLQLGSLSEALAQQLRTPWEGVEKMRPSHQALFAVMSLFYTYDINGGNRLLGDLALVSDSIRCRKGGMDVALRSEPGMMERIERIATGPEGRKLLLHADKHAWLETAFPTFLSICRKDRGVLPSAAFLWLKAEDRLLWYILNNVGNEAIMIEAAGAVAHWRAECQIGSRIRRPAVFQAARALLEDYLDQTPDRIATRQAKMARRRIPSEQVRLAVVERAGLTENRVDPDGIREE